MSDYPYSAYKKPDLNQQLDALRDRLESALYDRDCLRDAIGAFLDCDIDGGEWDETFEALGDAFGSSTGRNPLDTTVKAPAATEDTMDWYQARDAMLKYSVVRLADDDSETGARWSYDLRTGFFVVRHFDMNQPIKSQDFVTPHPDSECAHARYVVVDS